MVRGRKGEYLDLFEDLRSRGFSRVRVDGQLRRLDEEIKLAKTRKHDIDVVVDRMVVKDSARSRMSDSVETALELAQGPW